MYKKFRFLPLFKCLSLGVLSLLFISSGVQAKTVIVGPAEGGAKKDGGLLAAIASAEDGDTLVVEPGTYILSESLNFGGKNITLVSSAGPEATHLQLAKNIEDLFNKSVVVFDSGETGDAVLEGFTLSGGQGTSLGGVHMGGGIFFSNSNPSIVECVITSNEAQAGGGAAIQDANPTFISCKFTKNSASFGLNHSKGLKQHGGGALVITGSSNPRFEETLFAENTANNGGAVLTQNSSHPRFTNCVFQKNEATQGGVLASRGTSYPSLTNCILSGNVAGHAGGAVHTSDGSYPRIRHTTMTGNRAEVGSGIFCGGSSYPLITNCIVWGNQGNPRIVWERSQPRITFSLIDVGNPSDNPFANTESSDNINADPEFVDSGRFDDKGTPNDTSDDEWVEGDYHLKSISPAIDNGTELTNSGFSERAPDQDFNGNNRICWATVDLGAFEYCDDKIPGRDLPFIFVERKLDPQREVSPTTAITQAEHGRLMMRDAGGDVSVIVDSASPEATADTPLDVMDPDVSFDGSKIVFSGYSKSENAWRIFEVRKDGTGLRQITQSDRQLDLSRYGAAAERFFGHDDLDPCYLPDGRICFVSTRYPGAAPARRLRATNLYVVNSDGSNVHRITTERFGADTPTVDPTTGRVVYSRWWMSPESARQGGEDHPSTTDDQIPTAPLTPPKYYGPGETPPPPGPVAETTPNNYRREVLETIPADEFPGVNLWSLASINPDGTDLKMFSGFHVDRQATMAYRPTIREDGSAVALFLTDSPRIGDPGVFGARKFERGAVAPRPLGGPQTFAVPDENDKPFIYSSAVPLDGDRMIVTGSKNGVRTPSNFDLFIQVGTVDPVRVHSAEPGYAVLDATPLRPRETPKVVSDDVFTVFREDAPRSAEEAINEGGKFTFHALNIFSNAPVDTPIPNAPPIGKRLFMEFYMAPQGDTLNFDEKPTLLHRVQVPQSGEIKVDLPAGVPLFEVLTDDKGDVVTGRDGQIYHVGGMNFGTPGKTSQCVGCHAGHSMMEVPHPLAIRATNLAPSARISASSVKTARTNEGQDFTFEPQFLVDRRTDYFRSFWAAKAGDTRPTIRMEWDVPLQINEVKIHPPPWGRGVIRGNNHMVIKSVEIRLISNGEVVRRKVEDRGWFRLEDPPISVHGTNIDTVEIQILEFSGDHEDVDAPALAEIEVWGEAMPSSVPELQFIRGDSNSDGLVDISDAVTTLTGLFIDSQEIRCRAAADSNSDAAVDMSDAIHFLSYRFLGTEPPAAPFPACGPTEDIGLGCEESSCR